MPPRNQLWFYGHHLYGKLSLGYEKFSDILSLFKHQVVKRPPLKGLIKRLLSQSATTPRCLRSRKPAHER
ncbi:hypothetical protein Hanom_Chr11g01002661 [Helianthus anomalus]